MQLLKPGPQHIKSYLSALARGWHDLPTGSTAENVKSKIREIQDHTSEFLDLFDDHAARALPYLLPDKSVAYAIPSIRRWIWDETRLEYCGTVSLRWQKGSTELPPHLMGHIGYSVPPWMQDKGFASTGLKEILKVAKVQGLPFVHIVTDIDNFASIRVIEKNNGTLIEKFTKPEMYGAGLALRYKITTN